MAVALGLELVGRRDVLSHIWEVLCTIVAAAGPRAVEPGIASKVWDYRTLISDLRLVLL